MNDNIREACSAQRDCSCIQCVDISTDTRRLAVNRSPNVTRHIMTDALHSGGCVTLYILRWEGAAACDAGTPGVVGGDRADD